jgi:hypothetical protein
VRGAVLGAALCLDLHALAGQDTQARVTARGSRALRNQQGTGSIPAVGSIKSNAYAILHSSFSFSGSIPEAGAGPRRATVRLAQCLDKSRALPGAPTLGFECFRKPES